MKLRLNVSFYSAIGLIEKFYVHIFVDLKICRKSVLMKTGLERSC